MLPPPYRSLRFSSRRKIQYLADEMTRLFALGASTDGRRRHATAPFWLYEKCYNGARRREAKILVVRAHPLIALVTLLISFAALLYPTSLHYHS